jgi:hypothetical protein
VTICGANKSKIIEQNEIYMNTSSKRYGAEEEVILICTIGEKSENVF